MLELDSEGRQGVMIFLLVPTTVYKYSYEKELEKECNYHFGGSGNFMYIM